MDRQEFFYSLVGSLENDIISRKEFNHLLNKHGYKNMIFYECSICEHCHPWEWNGDCRDDRTRYTHTEIELLEEEGLEVEIRSMTDRLIADGFYTQEEGEKVARELGDFITE